MIAALTSILKSRTATRAQAQAAVTAYEAARADMICRGPETAAYRAMHDTPRGDNWDDYALGVKAEDWRFAVEMALPAKTITLVRRFARERARLRNIAAHAGPHVTRVRDGRKAAHGPHDHGHAVEGTVRDNGRRA